MGVRLLAALGTVSFVVGCGGNARDGLGADGGSGSGGNAGASFGGSDHGGSDHGGSDHGGSGVGGTVEPVEVGDDQLAALESLVVAQCETEALCCGVGTCDPPSDPAVWAAENAALGLSVDIDCALQLTNYYELGADCAFQSRFWTCCTLFHGRKRAGEACQRDECEQGLICDGSDGVCVANVCDPFKAGLGEPCGDRGCEAGLSCDAEQSGTCVRTPQEGERCVGVSCGFGLTCVDETCVEGKPDGAVCGSHSECLSANCQSGACVHVFPQVCHFAK